MKIIEIILSSSCIALVFVVYARLYEALHLNFKPFNCEVCLSFWTCIAQLFFMNYSFHFYFIGYAAISYVLTLLIRSLIKPFGS